MPFKSTAQRGFLYAKHPKLAKEFEAATPEGAKLPEHVKKMAKGGDVQEPFNGFGNLAGLHDLLKRAAAGENIHEAPKTNPEEEGKMGKFLGDFNVNAKNPNEKKGMKEEAGNYAFGGETNPKHETLSAMENNPTAGFADGGDVQYPAGGYSGAGTDNLRAILDMIRTGGMGPALPGSNLTSNLASSIGEGVTAPGTAGVLNNQLGTSLSDTPQTPPPAPPVAPSAPAPVVRPAVQPASPSMGQTMQNLNQTPDTNYDFYKNIGADQRAALYNQLLEKQRSPGNLAAQALGGIGSSIANSFGGQHTNFQDEARGIAEKNTENRIGAVDTQRAQKLQDMNANIEMQMNDPNSRVSQSMQRTLKSAGLNVPSGMPGSIMLKIAGPLGELAMKQATIAEMSQYHKAEVGEKEAARKLGEAEYKTSHPILNAFNPIDEETAPHGIPDLGQTFNGSKVKAVRQVR